MSQNNRAFLFPGKAKKAPHKFAVTRIGKLYFLVSEYVTALCLCLSSDFFLPHTTNSHRMVEAWLVLFSIIWLASNQHDNHQIFQPYARPLKLVICTTVAAILLSAIFRTYYSLHFFAYISAAWLCFSWVNYYFAQKFLPPIKIISPDDLPESILKSEKIAVLDNSNPTQDELIACDFILIDFNKTYNPYWQYLLTHAFVSGIPVMSTPEFIEKASKKIPSEYLNENWWQGNIFLMPTYAQLKRGTDLALVTLLSPILIPLMVLLTLCVLLFNGRPVFFTQKRVGRNHRHFPMIKFRTMRVSAETDQPNFTQKEDHRILKFGNFLRRTRLDELPQFINVIKGDMSIIGPRPEQVGFAQDFAKNIPMYSLRHRIRPGITGWAQVMQGYADSEDTTREKLRYDLYYVKNLSFWLDLQIYCKTIWTALTGFGQR